MRIILDCNVIISAVLTDGIPRMAFDHAIRRHECFLSQEIVNELRKTIHKPRFHLMVADMEKTLHILIDTSTFVIPTPSVTLLPDPDDTVYLATAMAAFADVIVTGNRKDFPVELCRGVRILTPREFLQL